MSVRDLLERLVDDMVTHRIQFQDAQVALERRFATQTLAATHGNVSKAADRLGIHRNTRSRKLVTYRIRPCPFANPRA